MPYRRFPTTDQSRLHALRRAVQAASEADFNSQVLSYHTLLEAQKMLLTFETQVSQYRANFQSKVTANKQYRHIVGNVRMYISHFIQVLNMAITRGEIKREVKKLYHLNPEENSLPDLSTEEDLLLWGERIIHGEEERIRQGGFPIYNPNINKVKVYYDIFKEQQVSHNLHQKTVGRVYEDLGGLRQQVDALLQDVWNQVEEYYRDRYPYERLMACQAYGVIYYYRTGEKRLTPEMDKQLRAASQMQTQLEL